MSAAKEYLRWFLWVYLRCCAWAIDTIDCTNDDIVTSVFNEPIPLDFKGTIHVYENVVIDELLSMSNNEVDIKYIDARLISTDNQVNDTKNLVIFTTESFSDYAKVETATRITLKLVFACGAERQRTLVFFQPLSEGNYFEPVFSSDIYTVRLPTPVFSGFDLTYFEEISARDNDLWNNQVVFSSNDAADYAIAVETKNLTADNGKKFFASLVLQRAYLYPSVEHDFQFTIIATDQGTPPLSARAVVVVHVDAENQLPLFPAFSQHVYYSKLKTDLTMDPLEISLANQTYSDDVSFVLNGTDATLFEIRSSFNVVTLSLAKPLSFSDIQEKSHLEAVILAYNPVLSSYGSSTIIVLLSSIEENFRFVKNLYEGFIDSSGNLDIETVSFEPRVYTSAIRFELRGRYADYFDLIEQANVLSLSLTPHWSNASRADGVLSLEIAATKDQYHASTIVLLRVLNEEIDIARPSSEYPQTYALIVMEILEEEAHENILDMRIGECVYHIASVYPADKPYVFVNELTQKLSSIAIDREDESFANMSTPQLRVELQLVCPKRTKRAVSDFVFSEILARDIPNNPSRTVLNLIILDINDNAPVFMEPVYSPFSLGYPDTTICFELFPQHVFQVKATDRDAGLNAEIRFTISQHSVSDFGIDTLTGVVYPKKLPSTTNVTEITVVATDRAGAVDGLSSSVVLRIQPLTSNHVVLLSYDTSDMLSLDTTLQRLSKSSQLQFGVIRRAILSTSKENLKRREISLGERDEKDFMLKAWIYALKSSKAVPCSELQKELMNASTLMHLNFMVESFEDVGFSPNSPEENYVEVVHIIYLVIIVLLATTSIVSLCFLWRHTGFVKCCANPAITATNCEMNCAAAPSSSCVHMQHGSCTKCSTNPFGFSSETVHGFVDRPAVTVTHVNSDAPVEFQTEGVQVCKGKPSKTI